jgi:hypothetical protein
VGWAVGLEGPKNSSPSPPGAPVWKDWEESAGLVPPKWFLHEGGREEGFHGAGSWEGRNFITFISIKKVEEAFLFTGARA